MGLFEKPPLDPIVKGISTTEGYRYDKCRATVELEVSDGNGGRKDLTITYPTQGEKHLVALMTDKETGDDITHTDMQTISKVVRAAIGLDKEEEDKS